MPAPDDLAERLATWLEALGLVPALADAGLPTVDRGEDGRARWTDPATGEPLGGVELAALDDLLHHQGEEPAHAVPVALVQLARQARLREELLASGWHDYRSLAELRRASVEATRFAVHKAHAEHRLLLVPAGDKVLVPAFQLDGDGSPRADLGPLLAPLLAADSDAWRVWTWLTQPAALLGGLVPEQSAADPVTAELAAWGAVRLAERSVRR